MICAFTCMLYYQCGVGSTSSMFNIIVLIASLSGTIVSIYSGLFLFLEYMLDIRSVWGPPTRESLNSTRNLAADFKELKMQHHHLSQVMREFLRNQKYDSFAASINFKSSTPEPASSFKELESCVHPTHFGGDEIEMSSISLDNRGAASSPENDTANAAGLPLEQHSHAVDDVASASNTHQNLPRNL